MTLTIEKLFNQGGQLTKLRFSAIGDRLRTVRLRRRISLSVAGAHVGRSRQSVAGWESGETEIGVIQLAQLATFYGVTADYLIFGTDGVPYSQEFSEEAMIEMQTDFDSLMRGPL